MSSETLIIHSLLIVTDGKLQVTRDNTLLLVITSGIASKLENLGGKILEDGSEVDYAAEISLGLETVEGDLPGAPAPTRCA